MQEGSVYASKVEDKTNGSAMDEGVSKQVVTLQPYHIDDGYDKYALPISASFRCQQLDRLLEHDPLRRYEFDECARSPFFRIISFKMKVKMASLSILALKSIWRTYIKRRPQKLRKGIAKAELPEGGLWKRRMFSLVVSTTSTLENQSAVVDISSLQMVEESDLERNRPGFLQVHRLICLKKMD